MKIPKGHAKRVQEIAAATPRQAVANLLSAMLPRVPVAMRAPSPAAMPQGAPAQAVPDPLSKLRRKLPRRRAVKARSQPIVPLVEMHRCGIRYGCGRYVKLKLIWNMYYDAVERGVTLYLSDVLGQTTTDMRGNLHVVNMGAINGMLERGHIRLEGVDQ